VKIFTGGASIGIIRGEMSVRRFIAPFGGILVIAGITLATGSSTVSASTAPATSGTETLAGSTTNVNASSLPLTLRGPVATHGTLVLNNSNSTRGVIKTQAGNLDVTHTNPPNTQPKVNMSACTATQVMAGTYKVTGGTGKFSGATGHGDFTTVFKGTFTKTNGQCKLTSNSNPTSGTLTFHASGPLTVG
jgi:hypothetical protein